MNTNNILVVRCQNWIEKEQLKAGLEFHGFEVLKNPIVTVKSAKRFSYDWGADIEEHCKQAIASAIGHYLLENGLINFATTKQFFPTDIPIHEVIGSVNILTI